MTDAENNLLTKIILGTVMEQDLFTVSNQYDVVSRFICSNDVYNILDDFGIHYGEHIRDRYRELFISYKNKISYTHPASIIAVIYEKEGGSYWVRTNTKGLV